MSVGVSSGEIFSVVYAGAAQIRAGFVRFRKSAVHTVILRSERIRRSRFASILRCVVGRRFVEQAEKIVDFLLRRLFRDPSGRGTVEIRKGFLSGIFKFAEKFFDFPFVFFRRLFLRKRPRFFSPVCFRRSAHKEDPEGVLPARFSF